MKEKSVSPKHRPHKIKLKDILILQAVFIIYSMSSVGSKLASQALDSFESIFTLRFILPALMVVMILGIYAIIWQQIIKRFDISIAYANKATTLLWSLVWGLLLFNETITLPKVLGIAIVFSGVIIMNSEAIS
ncbi:MAG: transporter [Lachnospiraceae bacterium]|nr:transporter [Lachnospiraceae bacterium]